MTDFAPLITETPAEHPFAPFVRILGKGKRGARSLTREEAREAMGMLLDDKVEDTQLGAFLMLLRHKEESPEELAGFTEALRERLDAPPLAVDLDWPTYAGKKRHLPWYLLAERKTPGFLDYFLVGEHWRRFTVPGWDGDRYGNAHLEPRGMIWAFLLQACLPWSLLLPLLALIACVALVLVFASLAIGGARPFILRHLVAQRTQDLQRRRHVFRLDDAFRRWRLAQQLQQRLGMGLDHEQVARGLGFEGDGHGERPLFEIFCDFLEHGIWHPGQTRPLMQPRLHTAY